MNGQDGWSWIRRMNWTLFWTAVGSLAAVAALVLALDIFPSPDSGTADNVGTTNGEKGGSVKQEGVTEEGSAAESPPSGEKLWSGEISLVANENYALDGFPIEPFEGYCDGCIIVNGFSESLEVENGVREWTESTPPTYETCLGLLESGPAPSVPLVTSPNAEGIEVGDWVCAFSKSGEILRLQYLGESQDEVNIRFMATGWRQSAWRRSTS